MAMAIEEATMSLRQGNCGFGAVLAKNNELIAKAHDTEKTAGDSTAHAEMTVIRCASAKLGRDLSGCVLIATHEPCPMCATAIIWSGITEIAFGYSIKEAIKQGRKRIDLSCKELFKRAGKEICVNEALLHDQCSVLYNKTVRDSIDQLRGADKPVAGCGYRKTGGFGGGSLKEEIAMVCRARPLPGHRWARHTGCSLSGISAKAGYHRRSGADCAMR